MQFVADAARGGRRNREHGVESGFVGEGIFALAEVAGIVIVQQVVVAHFAVRIHGVRKRLEIFHDRGDSRLRGVGAVAVGAAAVGRGTVRAAAVTIFCVPVVGAGRGIGIFNFVHHAGVGSCRDPRSTLCGGSLAWPSAVGEVDGIAVAEHDVVGAGAALHGLVEVVAHRVGVGEILEVGSVALLHVVEAERGGAFTGGGGAGQVVDVEIGGLLRCRWCRRRR